jgi:hypothetical protein
MDLIQQGYEVLYIWSGQGIEDIEKEVTEIKKTANVKLENAERISFGKLLFIHEFQVILTTSLLILLIASHSKSSFDIILVNNPSIAALNEESLKVLLTLVKPKGKVVFATVKSNELESRLVLTGFVNVKHEESKNCE